MNIMSPHPAFEHLRTAQIESLNIEVREYRHTQTGAQHIHLAADNPENVFLVGLRTIPTDSSGVAHILEHTVLCGSEKYPVRDPFFMMIRRSLNTFMNAFTASDWTAYPFASQNRKDYFNLLDVYLDAVFFSRIHELDFMQEGHRVEFDTPDNPDTDLVFKGVVFNEMKGAMSSPTSILYQQISRYLHPNNTYHYNSGGDPEAIPDLSYSELVNFYKTHYHPSNAVFMTYGDIPAAELQARFEDQVLARFDRLDRVIKVDKAHRIHSPVRIEEAYANEEADASNRTHVTMSWLLGPSSNLDDRLQTHLLSSVLLDNSASPLMQALEKTELGNAPSQLCGVDDGSLEMIFVCGIDGTEPDKADDIEELILSVLREVAEKGVPKEQVDAVLHQLELSQREIRGDGMPFGLTLLLNGLSPAMQRADAIAALDLDPALERLRQATENPEFIPDLVKRLLLNNTHRVRLTLRPDNKVSELRLQAEKQRLADMKASLSDEEKQRIVDKAKALAERQSTEDDPDILPKVTLADVPPTLHICSGTQATIESAPAMHYAQGTNGLVYPHIVIDLPELEDELLQLLPIYTSFASELGSGGRDYLETQALHASVTGGISAQVSRRSHRDDEQKVDSFLILRGKALLRNAGALSDILNDTLYHLRFDEHARIRELLAQTRTSAEQSVTGRGHVLAMSAASSGMSPISQLSHRLSGLAGIQSLKKLDELAADDASLAQMCDKLGQIAEKIKVAPRRFMLVAEQDNLEDTTAQFASIFTKTSDDSIALAKPARVREQVKQLWTTSTEVNFCATSYPVVPSAHEDSAALNVLGSFLRNGYLHRSIRETGGAYGGGASYNQDAASFNFYSYRDPRLVETLNDFDGSIEWLLNEKHDEQALEEAILNVVSSIDKPASPVGEARNAYQGELFGRTPELRQAARQKILSVSLNDLKRVGETYFDKSKASAAVITNSARSEEGEVKALGLELNQL